MDTIDFEQEMDNNENKNPPFFGKRFRKKRVKDDEDRGKGENPGLRVGFMYKNRQIDLDDNEEDFRSKRHCHLPDNAFSIIYMTI